MGATFFDASLADVEGEFDPIAGRTPPITTNRRAAMTAREPKIPGPDHPITIEATSGHVVARVGTHVIANTTRAHKGDASYYSIALPNGQDACHVAFYTDRVEVVVEAA
jgi:hypothetical protein